VQFLSFADNIVDVCNSTLVFLTIDKKNTIAVVVCIFSVFSLSKHFVVFDKKSAYSTAQLRCRS
jgi:hypothetical protein